MSDLIFSTAGLTTPPTECTESPPEETRRGVTPEDPCHIEIPFSEETEAPGPARMLRFDRAGDQFILSPSNGLEAREWFESHENVAEVSSVLRMLNAMIRVPRLEASPQSMHAMLALSQYVVRGEVLERTGSELLTIDRVDLGRGLLELFADTREDILGPFLGQLQVVRRSSWLGEDALDRLRWITSMLDLVPQFRAFRRHLIEQRDIENFYSLSQASQLQISYLTSFAGWAVVSNELRRPMRFGSDFLDAQDAYLARYGSEIEAGSREDFCTALEAALRELRGGRGGAELGFLEECRTALRLREVEPEAAIRETFREALISSAGLREMQEEIAEESEVFNMSVTWLTEQGEEGSQGRIGEILGHVMNHLEIRLPEVVDGTPELVLNVPALQLELQTLIDAHATTRREFILAGLAVMRRLAGEGDEEPTVRVFFNDGFREVALRQENRVELRGLISILESRIEASQEGSDIALPIVEAGACLLGMGGVILAETLPEIRRDEGLHLGIGITSVAIGGAGCAAFLGHFFWPAVGEVRNRYLWEGITGIGGALISAGIYLLVNLLGGGATPQDPGMRFPVDEYGP